MGVGGAEVRRLWNDLLRVRAQRQSPVESATRPQLVETERGKPGSPVMPMPEASVLGPGRNRAFRLPQYFAIVNGVRTAFCDAGRGPAVVFIHGLAGDLTHWVYVAPHFVGRHRVIGVDLPASGESERPRGPLSVRMFAKQVHGLLDVLGVERAAIVGHSLGGMVAAELALLHPERVSRLVLINPAGFQKMPYVLRAAGHAFLRPAFVGEVFPHIWKRILDVVFCEQNEHTRAFVRSLEETYRTEDIHDIAATIAGLRADFLDHDYLAVLDLLRQPMLLLWGADDLLTPAKALRATAARMPNVTTRELPRCGHMPIIEQPAETIRRIEAHLAAERPSGLAAAAR
jgi:pimeloyl-ACP methyl ester carboxylesterase